MSEIPLCSIVISSKLAVDEIESLETALSLSSIKVQKSPSRVLGADDILFILAVIGGIDAATNVMDRSIKAAKTINNWRRKLKDKGIKPEGRLEHPKRPCLDLSTATDEEIEEWLSQK
jgi:hypothetical protein